MSLSDMQIFNEYLMPAVIETLDQQVEKFNGASNNTIILTSAGFDGSALESSFYQALHSAQRRVNRFNANSSVSSTDLSQEKEVAVKVAGGFGPILFEPSQLSWLRKSTDEAVEVISRNLVEAIMQDQLNTGIASAVAAIANNAGTVVDVSGDNEVITQSVLNDSHALFGDSSMLLQSQVMTGTQAHKLVGQAILNDNRLFAYQSILVVDILGKPIVVTDSPALREGTGASSKQKVLSLAANGIVISDGSDIITNIETKNGKARIETTMQADYTFGTGLKGYKWDIAAGGESPSDSALATGTNWPKVKTYNKHTAGVLAIGLENAAAPPP
jgi:hypothetical protein